MHCVNPWITIEHIDYTDVSRIGDGHATEEDKHAQRISSPRDMALKNANTAPYEILGELFIQTTLERVKVLN